MAGNYDDAPSRRMGYDADGTVGISFHQLFTNVGEATDTNMVNANSESETVYQLNSAAGVDYWFCLLFPEKRELDGVFAATGNTSNYSISTVQSSVDTTGGIDGAWVTQVADMPDWGVVAQNYRQEIQSLAVATVTGIRCLFVSGSVGRPDVKAFHVYGPISPGETPDRILFLDTLNSDAVFTKPIDYGEVPRGQTQQRTIKLKNNSASKTINTVQITAEDLFLNAGGWYTFSTDDVSYQATLAVGNLGVGATQPIYVKQSLPDAETLGLQTGRLKVSHASLT